MEIIIHIQKRKLDTDFEKAIAEYIKRTSPYCKVKTVCYKREFHPAIQAGSAVYQIVPGKETMSSEAFASHIEQQTISGHSRLEFIISSIPVRTDSIPPYQTISLSSFSMSEDLTAVVLAEQIYRAYTILNHITYHK